MRVKYTLSKVEYFSDKSSGADTMELTKEQLLDLSYGIIPKPLFETIIK